MSNPLRWLKSRPGLDSIALTKSKDQTRQAFQESCHCTSVTLGQGSLQWEQTQGIWFREEKPWPTLPLKDEQGLDWWRPGERLLGRAWEMA